MIGPAKYEDFVSGCCRPLPIGPGVNPEATVVLPLPGADVQVSGLLCRFIEGRLSSIEGFPRPIRSLHSTRGRAPPNCAWPRELRSSAIFGMPTAMAAERCDVSSSLSLPGSDATHPQPIETEIPGAVPPIKHLAIHVNRSVTPALLSVFP